VLKPQVFPHLLKTDGFTRCLSPPYAPPALWNPQAGGLGPNHAGLGPNRAGLSPNRAGLGPNPAGYSPNPAGLGPNHAGLGPNHAGLGPNHAGLGPNRKLQPLRLCRRGWLCPAIHGGRLYPAGVGDRPHTGEKPSVRGKMRET
jgi:hypothetical protein